MINIQYSFISKKIYFEYLTSSKQLAVFVLVSINYKDYHTYVTLDSIIINEKYKKYDYYKKLIKYVVFYLKNKKYKYFICKVNLMNFNNFSSILQDKNLCHKIKKYQDFVCIKFDFYKYTDFKCETLH